MIQDDVEFNDFICESKADSEPHRRSIAKKIKKGLYRAFHDAINDAGVGCYHEEAQENLESYKNDDYYSGVTFFSFGEVNVAVHVHLPARMVEANHPEQKPPKAHHELKEA